MKTGQLVIYGSRLLMAMVLIAGLLQPDASALAGSPARQPGLVQAAVWMTQNVLAAQGATPLSMVVDDAGIIHIAYYSSSNWYGLHHAWFDGAMWQDEHLDTISGSAVDIAAGSDGQLFILYDNADSVLKLAAYDGISWSTGAIVQGQAFEQKEYGSLAVDDNGALHVSFYNRPDNSLYYGVRVADSWQFTQVQSSAGRQTSIAIDSQGFPHISYCAVNDLCAGLRHAAYNGSSWNITGISTGMGLGAYSQLAFGADGQPLIAAYESTNQAVRLFRKTAVGIWETVAVENNVGDGGPLGLAVDAAGTIHLAYSLQASGDLRYASYTTGLNIETAASTGDVGARPALALDANGTPLIAHQDSTNQVLLTSHSLGADLRVTDVWENDGKISFQVLNAGLAPAVASAARLTIDAVQMGGTVSVGELPPGGRQTINLVAAYTCGTPSDTVQVQVDSTSLVMESDETNNSLTEVWLCNRTPLSITSGPAISGVSATTATFTWTTNITADSYVGVTTGRKQDYAWTGPGSFGTSHTITLTGLLPDTTYEAVARSTRKGYPDVAATSRPVYFTTLPAAVKPPTGAGSSISRSTRAYESYSLVSSLTDTADVARMDFFIDGVLVGSDYTPNNLGQFELEYVPGASGVTRQGWYGSGHTLTTSAVLFDGQTVQQSSPFNAASEPMEITLSFGQPSSGQVLYTPGASMPAGSLLPLSVFAEEYGWRCSTHGGSPADPDASPILCADQAAPVMQLKLYLDSAHQLTFAIGGKTYFEHNLPVNGLTAGQHKLTAVAIASDGTQETLDLPFSVVQSEVKPQVTHSGYVEGSHVVVLAVITNPASSPYPIEVNKVYETAHGLQFAAQTSSMMTASSAYDPATRNTWITFGCTAGKTLAPGQSLVIQYALAPILYEDMGSVTYWLNKERMTVVDYTVQGFNSIIGVPSELSVLDHNGVVVTFDMGVRLAMPNADYLIVTNPPQLIATFGSAKTDQLLAKMGELAATKQGVLGYLDTYDDGSILNGLIAEGSPWLGRLNPVFEDLVDGYVLLVGDLRIIASDRSMSLWMPHIDQDDYRRVHHTDNIYAHTQGDGRPDLVVSRLIGSIDTMITSLQTSLDVYNGANGRQFNKWAASFVSGSEPRDKDFESSVRTLRDTAGDYGHPHNEVYFDYQSALWYYDFNHEAFDGVAGCDVDHDGDEELIHGDRSADKIYILNPVDGSVIGTINQNFEEGDGLACGDVDDDGFDEIIFGDRADKIITYDHHTSTSSAFSWNFMAYDQLAVGDLVPGNPGEEIIVADRDDYIHVLTKSGSLLLTLDLRNYNPPIDFMEGDKVAVGDVNPFLAGAEIVITSRAADQVILMDAIGAITNRFARDLEYGDDLAVGSPFTAFGGQEEIIIGDRNNYVTVYQVDLQEGNVILAARKDIHSDFEMNDRITTVRVKASDPSATIIEFMRDDQISALDINFPAHGLDLLFDNMQTIGADLLMYRGHGASNAWSTVMDASQVRDFGSLAPVVVGTTCLSGDYPDLEDLNMGASVLKHGAGLYIGATETSVGSYNSQMAPMFLTRFFSSRAAAADWTHLERKVWGYSGEADYYYYWVYEYNLYGETKFGKSGPTLLPTLAAAAPIALPAASQVVTIPAYVRADNGVVSTFTIPDGGLHTVEGEPVLPVYSVAYDYPAGTLVQNVALSSQVLSETLEGMILPVFDPTAMDGVRPAGLDTAILANNTSAEPGWLPALDQPFTWQVTQHSDGSSTLEILMYPMQYAPDTLIARYFNQFTFNITTASTNISISDLRTDQARYSLGSPVTIDMIVNNSGAAQDLSVVAEVRRGRSTQALSSVPFALIKDLSGEGHYTAMWDSAGLEAGQYTLDVRLYNSSSQLMSQSFYDFNLGLSELEVQNLASSVDTFKPGVDVVIDFDVANTGEEALDGLAYIQIQGANGYTSTLSQGLNLLGPGSTQHFTFDWNASGVPNGAYTIYAYVSFASRISIMHSLVLPNQRPLFLPLVVRK